MPTFRDFSGRHVLDFARVERPGSLAELRRVVVDAERSTPPLQVSAMGSAWAFSAPAYNPGVIVDTSRLAGFPEFLQSCVVQPPDGPEVYTAVAAGTKVRDMYLALRGEPRPGGPRLPDAVRAGRTLAPPTLGGAGGQSLAGVVSTGTHGGDVARPPIGDYVRAAVLVGSGGRVRVVQEPSLRAVDVAALNARHQAETGGAPFEEYAVDGALAAVTTAVGRLGVVYAYVYAVHDETGMSVFEWRYQDVWSRVRTQLDAGRVLADARADDEFLQVVMAPVREPGEDRPCFVTRHLTAATDRAATVAADFRDPRLPDTTPSQEVQVARRNDVMDWVAQSFGVDRVTPTVQTLRETLYAFAALAAAAALAVGGPVAFFAALPLVLVVRELADDLGTLGPDRIFGDVVARALNSISAGPYGVVTVMVIRGLITDGQSPTRPDGQPWLVHGPRGTVMDGYQYPEDHGRTPLYRGDSVEVFFPADRDLSGKVEVLLGVLEAAQRAGSPLAAYVSLRFFASSRALLATTEAPGTTMCAVEVSMLRGLRGNDQALEELQARTLGQTVRGRVHWGQQNDLVRHEVETSIGGARVDAWRAHLRALEGGSTTFLTPFAAGHGLDVARDTSWVGWHDLDMVAGGDPFVVSGGPAGAQQLAVLAVDRGGRLHIDRQAASAVPATRWVQVVDRVLARQCAPSAVVRLDDGRLEMFAVTPDGQLGHVWQDNPREPDRFSGLTIKTALWGHRLTVSTDAIASVIRTDGDKEVYAVEDVGQHRLVHTGTEGFHTFQDLGPDAMSTRFAAAARTAGGEVDSVLFGIGASGDLRWRLHRRGPWRVLPPLPDEQRALQVTIVAGHLVASSPSGLWACSDTAPERGEPLYDAWHPVPPAPATEPLAPDSPLTSVTQPDGAGWLFGLGRTGHLLGVRRTRAGWETWLDLGGSLRRGSRLGAGVLPDGRVLVVGRRDGADVPDLVDHLMARAQTSPGAW